MEYKPYTKVVLEIIAQTKQYPFIHFEINVDGTGYLTVCYSKGNYYDRNFTNPEMKMPATEMAELIIANVECYFNGWAVRKGLRKIN